MTGGFPRFEETPRTGREAIEAEKITLDWRRWVAAQQVSHQWLADARLTVMHDHVFPSLIVRVERDVLSDKRAEDTYEKTLAVPTSTWQFFKNRHRDSWWMRWYVRLRPVDTNAWQARLVVERWQTYPEARLPREQYGRAVIFEQVRGPWWEERS